MQSFEAYRIEIRPSEDQEVLLRKHCGLARYVYNWALGERIRWWDTNKDKSKEDRDPEPRAVELSRRWTKEHPEWSSELQRNTVTYALTAVDDAFKAFFRRVKNCTPPYGFPRFKKKGDCRDSFTLQDQSFLAEPRAIRLGKIGMVRTCQYVLPTPTVRSVGRSQPQSHWLRGRVLRIVVSRQADRWYASLMVERERADPELVQGDCVGIDLGINHAATISDGRVLEPSQVSQPALVRGARDPDNGMSRAVQLLRRLAHLERIKSKKLPGSKQRQRVVDKIARLQKHIADARGNHLHNASKLVSTTASVVVTEGYNVRELGMRTGPTRGQANASDTRRRMMTTGLGELRRQFEYKSKWYGSRFEKTDPHYPSDMTCSVCGHVNEHMRERSDSRFDCKNCGHASSRQMNTAGLLARIGRGEPFSAAPVAPVPQQSSLGRKSRRGPAGHAGTDTPGGASTSHGSQVRRGAAPVKGEACTTEEPLGHPGEDGGTP